MAGWPRPRPSRSEWRCSGKQVAGVDSWQLAHGSMRCCETSLFWRCGHGGDTDASENGLHMVQPSPLADPCDTMFPLALQRLRQLRSHLRFSRLLARLTCSPRNRQLDIYPSPCPVAGGQRIMLCFTRCNDFSLLSFPPSLVIGCPLALSTLRVSPTAPSFSFSSTAQCDIAKTDFTYTTMIRVSR